MGIAYDLICTECKLEMHIGKVDDDGFNIFNAGTSRFIQEHAAHDRGKLLLSTDDFILGFDMGCRRCQTCRACDGLYKEEGCDACDDRGYIVLEEKPLR